jgi:hypothetical protein
MGRGRKDSPEDWKRYKKLEQENEKLKREVIKLRKLVNSNCIDYLEEKEKKEEKAEKRGMKVVEPTESLCENCGKDEFKKIQFKRTDGEFEIKICSVCSHRGPLKRIKGSQEDEKPKSKEKKE